MTDQQAIEPILKHLRADVTSLRRLEQKGANAHEIEVYRLAIARLQTHLGYAVRDLLWEGDPAQKESLDQLVLAHDDAR